MDDNLYFADYDNLGELGSGAFATIVKVRHHELGYVRALKVLNGVIPSEKDIKYKNFLEECSVLLRIGNGGPMNIVRIYRPRLINNHACVEMDWVDGVTLFEYMKDYHQGVPLDVVFRFVEDIVGAMAYCHVDIYKYLMDPDKDNLVTDDKDGSKFIIDDETEKRLIQTYRVIHNDLHSNNVMVRHYDGHFVLLDFGLCVSGEKTVRSSQMRNGAPEYVSPEKAKRVLSGDKSLKLSPQEDVYSLGILMYELLTGKPPFVVNNPDSQEDLHRVYRCHMDIDAEEQGRLLKEKRKDVPTWLVEMVAKCLQKKPDNRFPDAKEMQAFFKTKLEEAKKKEEDRRKLIKKESYPPPHI